MYHDNPCWVILCQSQFDNHGLQFYTVQKCIMTTLVGLSDAKVNLIIIWPPILYSTKMYQVNPCWVILCQGQFDNHGLQFYTVQKCIMTTLVVLSYAKVSLIIMASNSIQYKNVSGQPLLGYLMPRSVW